MNNEDQQTEQAIPVEKNELEFTKEISGHLQGAGKWGKFLAILAFIVMGLMVFGGIVMSIVLAFIPTGTSSSMPFPPYLFGVIYLVIGAIYFLPILYLYRFSTGIRQALISKDQNKLAKAFYYLKAQYRFIGIFTIVVFCLYFVLLVVMVAAGLFAGLSSFPGMPA